jgi:thymidylate synthase
LFAKAANLEPGEIILAGGDAHVYLNHIEQVREQISRRPYSFPTMIINKDIYTVEDMENLCFDDFKFNDYQCHPAIKAPMCI